MNKKEITWAPLIPLIGGQALGAEKAFGKPPEAIYSFGGFEANDNHYVNYQQNTLGRDIPYVLLDSSPELLLSDLKVLASDSSEVWKAAELASLSISFNMMALKWSLKLNSSSSSYISMYFSAF